jgi:hypothetical protein
MSERNLIAEALAQPKDAIFHRLSESLAAARPDRYLLETEDREFNVEQFAFADLCELNEREDLHCQWQWGYDDSHGSDWRTAYNAWLIAKWNGHEFEIVCVGQQAQHCREQRQYLLGPDEDTTRAFFTAVCEWNSEVRDEVLVYDGGWWQKSRDLYTDIQSASFDNLVLEGNLREQITSDLAGFFESKDVYDRYGIAWKRGILLLGPPGNGKTHAVKAAINLLGKPCLYVKSFKSEYGTDHDNIRQVFKRARSSAPCVLVLEDLDSLIDGGNRSFFLNEMDGFASNSGILTIATTNHPERLDPSILERPSRFDRKYTFNLPERAERERYLPMFSSQLEPSLQLDEAALDEVAAATDGYSYAYLKELYLSAMMRWINDPRPIHSHMLEQCSALKAQMVTEPPVEDFEFDDDGNGSSMAAVRYMRRHMRRLRR